MLDPVKDPIETISSISRLSKTKYYFRIKFSQNTLESAYTKFQSALPTYLRHINPTEVKIAAGDEIWTLDTLDEFFAQYAKADRYELIDFVDGAQFFIDGNNNRLSVGVKLGSRSLIESVFNVLEKNLSDNILRSEKEPIRIFIGHGHSTQWRDLKDHLQDEHGLTVEAYEIGSRSGITFKETLESMLSNSSIAFLVLTSEDLDDEGKFHARENVIHELGLFQGRLGFERAIACLEEGVNEFSNIEGIDQIRFSRGGIKETYGKILATLKREFYPN